MTYTDHHSIEQSAIIIIADNILYMGVILTSTCIIIPHYIGGLNLYVSLSTFMHIAKGI